MEGVEGQIPSLFHYIFGDERYIADDIAIDAGAFSVKYQDLKEITKQHIQVLRDYGVNEHSVIAIGKIGGISILSVVMASSVIGCKWVIATPRTRPYRDVLGLTHYVKSDDDIGSAGLINIDVSMILKAGSSAQDEALVNDEMHTPDDVCCYVESSGSTGIPKLIALSRQYFNDSLPFPPLLLAQSRAAIATTFPMRSYLGLVIALSVLKLKGRLVVIADLPKLKSMQLDMIVGSPAQLGALCASAPVDGKRIAYCVSGGGPMQKDLYGKLANHFNAVINSFGSTETGNIAYGVMTHDQSPPYPVRHLVNASRIEIVDENGRLVDVHDEGRVRLSSATHASYYLSETGARTPIFQNGFFYTGDLGYRDHAGNFYFTGRQNDQFNLGGVKVSAIYVDDVMTGLQSVCDCVSFVDQDQSNQDVLAAIVVLEQDHTVDRFLAEFDALKSKVPRSFIPKRIYVGSSCPRNSNGKATRHLAQSMISGQHSLI